MAAGTMRRPRWAGLEQESKNFEIVEDMLERIVRTVMVELASLVAELAERIGHQVGTRSEPAQTCHGGSWKRWMWTADSLDDCARWRRGKSQSVRWHEEEPGGEWKASGEWKRRGVSRNEPREQASTSHWHGMPGGDASGVDEAEGHSRAGAPVCRNRSSVDSRRNMRGAV